MKLLPQRLALAGNYWEPRVPLPYHPGRRTSAKFQTTGVLKWDLLHGVGRGDPNLSTEKFPTTYELKEEFDCPH